MIGLLRPLVVSALILCGCERQSGPPEALPAGLLLAEAPPGATDIVAVRKTAKVGDEVVLSGRVGGKEDPIESGVASFRLVDASLKPCNEGGDMPKCATPWDYCCDDFDELQAKSATVQIVGTEGRPIRADLSTGADIKPLAEVTVKGKIAEAKDGKPLVVHATNLHAQRPREGGSPARLSSPKSAEPR